MTSSKENKNKKGALLALSQNAQSQRTRCENGRNCQKKERFLFWIFLYRAKHRCNSHPPTLSISRLSSGMLDVTNWNTDRRQKHIRPSNLYDQNQIRGATCSKNSSCWLVFSVICPLQHRQTNTIAPKKKNKNLFLHSNFPNLAEKYVPIILLFLLCCT